VAFIRGVAGLALFPQKNCAGPGTKGVYFYLIASFGNAIYAKSPRALRKPINAKGIFWASQQGFGGGGGTALYKKPRVIKTIQEPIFSVSDAECEGGGDVMVTAIALHGPLGLGGNISCMFLWLLLRPSAPPGKTIAPRALFVL
jgi:hypothetical protein